MIYPENQVPGSPTPTLFSFLRENLEGGVHSFLLLDGEGSLLATSKTFAGLSRETLLAVPRKWLGLFTQDSDLKGFKERLKAVAKPDSSPHEWTATLTPKETGKGSFQHLQVFPFWNGTGTYLGTAVLARKTASSDPTLSDLPGITRQLENVIDHASIPIVGFSREGEVLFYNRSARNILGYEAEEIAGFNWVRILFDAPDVRQKAIKRVQEHYLGKIIENEEWKLRCRNGQIRTATVSAAPIYSLGGTISGIVFFANDITELRNLEQRLQDKNEEMQDFVRLASHDLQSPLVSIQGYAQLIYRDLRGTLSPDQQRCFDGLFANVKKMRGLIEGVLDLARLDHLRHRFKPVPIEPILSEIARLCANNLEAKGGSLEVQTPMPELAVDPVLVETVFMNLVDNAIKYAGDQNPSLQIKITWRETEHDFEFSVADNGIGIAPEDLDRVFRPLVRLQNIEIHGKGMGLAFVKKIVERHGGRVWVKSSLGKGSTFFVGFPKKILSQE